MGLGVTEAHHLLTQGGSHSCLCLPGLVHNRHLGFHHYHQGPWADFFFFFTQYSQEHELHSHCQGLIFFLHSPIKKDMGCEVGLRHSPSTMQQ